MGKGVYVVGNLTGTGYYDRILSFVRKMEIKYNTVYFSTESNFT